MDRLTACLPVDEEAELSMDLGDSLEDPTRLGEGLERMEDRLRQLETSVS